MPKGPIHRTIKAADALLDLLEEEGIEHLFGVPGAALTPLYESIARGRRVRHVLAKHEAGAAFMAAGFARVSLGLSACCVTTGPGATNAVTGIASAMADSLPVVLLSGQTGRRGLGKGAFQESTPLGLDVVELFRPITKLSILVPSAERLVHLVRHALRVARAGRPGPVHLSLPADLLAEPIKVAAPRLRAHRASGLAIDRASLDAAAELLVRAERPALLAGHGVSLANAAAPLRALAERLGMPIATSPKAKGVFPEDHPLSLGVLGFAGHAHAETYLLEQRVDVLVVVGSSLGEWTTHGWSPRLQPIRALIQIDVDPTTLGRNYPLELGIVADAHAALEHLEARVASLTVGVAGLRTRDPAPLADLRRQVPRYVDLEPAEESTPIKPQHVVRELQMLPAGALLFVDIGNSMTWAGHYLECREPQSYVAMLGLSSMGSGLAGAIGGKLAAPERPVIALVGDGAFAMNGLEVHTAVEHDLPLVWIVLNDGGHGMIRHGERLLLGDHLGACEFRQPLDVRAIGQALGALAFHVTSRAELRAALAEALASGQPCVIDAWVDREAVPCSLAHRARAVRAALEPAPIPAGDEVLNAVA